jgi:hypothetical protein
MKRNKLILIIVFFFLAAQNMNLLIITHQNIRHVLRERSSTKSIGAGKAPTNTKQ